MIKKVCKALGFEYYIEHVATAEPSDYRGLAFPTSDKQSATFLPYGLLHKMEKATAPLVVFFDDIHNGMQAVQGPIAQIIEERRINNVMISPHVRFVAACNRKQDNAGANTLTTMLLSRFKTILEIKPDADAWCKWAVTANVPAVLIAYIRSKPEMISTFEPTNKGVVNFACPRTLEALSNWMNSGVYNKSVWAGCVGDRFALEFGAWFDVYTTLGNVHTNIAKGIAPTAAQSAQLQKPDVQFMVCAALSQLATKTNVHHIAGFIKTLSPEFENFFYLDAAARDVSIRQTASFIDFAVRNQGVI